MGILIHLDLRAQVPQHSTARITWERRYTLIIGSTSPAAPHGKDYMGSQIHLDLGSTKPPAQHGHVLHGTTDTPWSRKHESHGTAQPRIARERRHTGINRCTSPTAQHGTVDWDKSEQTVLLLLSSSTTNVTILLLSAEQNTALRGSLLNHQLSKSHYGQNKWQLPMFDQYHLTHFSTSKQWQQQ